MNISLNKAIVTDAEIIHIMKVKSFMPLLEKLDTIIQEKGNCYLYEKLGYKSTGKTEVINDNMTLVFYEKRNQ